MNGKSKKQKLILRIIIGVSIAAMVGALVMIFRSLSEYKIGSDSYRELERFVTPPQTDSTSFGQDEKASRWPVVDFESLWEINPDVVAWLYCEDTAINYPIVQGSDNEYYLRRLLDGTWNIAGSLFMDSNNQPGFIDHNTIVYGHNLKDKSMFWAVAEYKKQDFYEAHPVMLLVTPEQNFEIQLFSGYVADPQKAEETWSTWFSSRGEFQGWIDATRERSTFECAVDPTTADHFITLSTCSYEWDDARYVAVGILVSEDELAPQ